MLFVGSCTHINHQRVHVLCELHEPPEAPVPEHDQEAGAPGGEHAPAGGLVITVLINSIMLMTYQLMPVIYFMGKGVQRYLW